MSDLDLAQYTTLRVGGPARGLVVAESTEQLVTAAKLAAEIEQPILLIGGGSNLLISDAGFGGTAVLVRSRGIEATSHSDGSVRVAVAAGEVWDDLVAWAVAQGLSGIESLSGIPGCVGAGPIQNIGAYGQEVGDVIERVDAVHRYTGAERTFTRAECEFGYRTSTFKQRKDVFVITRVHLRLTPSELSGPISYADLVAELGLEQGAAASLHDVRSAVLAVRRRKAMVLDASDHDTWSAGSFFTNPIVSAAAADALPATAPRWVQPDGAVKVSAAWLIEGAGFTRGYGTGSARLSSKHVLALTNADGRASAADVVALAREIRASVVTAYGIELVPEPVFVGLEL